MTRAAFTIGADSGTSSGHTGMDITHFYLAQEAMDFSVAGNIAKFYNAAGQVDFGANGSTPTGNQPLIYLNNPYDTFQNNLGSGGNFTENGVLVDGGYLDTDKLYSSDSFTNSYDLIHSHGKQFSAGGIGFTVGDHKKVGQCITLSSSTTISKLGFWVRRQGTLSGQIHAEIHGVTGTPNSSATSNNTILNVSNGIDSATTSTSDHFLLFTFPTPTTLPAGNYWVGINAFNMAGGGANYLSTALGHPMMLMVMLQNKLLMVLGQVMLHMMLYITYTDRIT